ncbi:hypothetical protein [Salinibacterium sp. PAMC 21357]|uniref:hypothetical protein n=1 Tax=Salinibacterium sp. PAMC 21357 TaxID=1112215 RepID=UPI0002896163|nr:hypothetical protein [Salinibacterium sp. PAMC 21357]
MPDQPVAPPTKPYNFVLGALASVLAIPITIAIAVIIGQFGWDFAGAGGGIGLMVAFALFASGSHRAVVRGAGFAFALLIGTIAAVLAVIAGFLSAVYHAFTAVGGDGGFFGSVFAGRVTYRLTEHPVDLIAPAAIAAFMTIILLIKYSRLAIEARTASQETRGFGAAHRGAAVHQAEPHNAEPHNRVPRDATALDVAAPDHTPPAAPPATINASSSGILLNGKPLNDQEPKKPF